MKGLDCSTGGGTLFQNQPSRRDLRSQSLDLLRFPLALVIVASHVLGYPGLTAYLNQPIDYAGMPAVQWLSRIINNCLTGYSVPIYFFIAGYVFFLNINFTKEVYVRKIHNRFRSLFIPYISWNLLTAVFFVTLYIIGRHSRPWLAAPDFSLSACLSIFWDGSTSILPAENPGETLPIDMPLWFVKILMIIAICTPIISWLNRKCGPWFTMVLGCIWIILSDSEYGDILQVVTGFFFFSWGGWMSQHQRDMIEEFGKLRLPSFIIFPVLCVVCTLIEPTMPDLWGWLKRINTIVGLFFAYNLSAFLITRYKVKGNRFLTSTAFFVYAGHCVFRDQVALVVGKIWYPHTGAETVVYLFIVWITLILLLMGIYWVMRRYTPRLLGIFTGGRL